MSRELLLLVDALAREKNVDKNIVFGALELALASATKKRFQRGRRRARSRSILRRASSRLFDAGRLSTIWISRCRPVNTSCTKRRRSILNAKVGEYIEEPLEGVEIRPHRRADRKAGHPAEDS